MVKSTVEKEMPVPGPRTAGAHWAAALVAALACGILAWLTPRPQSDLFLALAGGRDVFAGGLGAADTWSFATAGRIWIHQNWLGDAVIYAAERAGGETGLLVLKAALLAGIMAAVTLAARERRVAPAVGLLAAAAAVSSWPQALVLRANLISLILAPLLLLLLYRAARRPRMIWVATALVTLWANTHGSFMFGIALLGLWTLVHLVVAALGKGPEDRWKRAGLFAATTLVSAFAAGWANPFGWANLRTPFLVRTSDVWRDLTEWQPLFSDSLLRTRTPWIFLGLIAVLALGAGARRAFGGGRGEAGREAAPAPVPGAIALAPFETALAAILIVMAFQSQRFVLFAAVLLAPLVAIQLQWLLQPSRRLLPSVLAAGLVILSAWLSGSWVVPHYRPDNPARPAESVFGRMIHLGTHFPVGAAAFLNANDIGGRVYNEWRWEGFLRWSCPQLELFAGGRAHQAYAEDTVREYYAILDDSDAAERLKALDVHLVVVPLDADLGPFCLNLLQSRSSPWAYLYCDQMSAVFVDVHGPGHLELLNRALAGGLSYGDEATAALSRAMCLSSPALNAPPGETLMALEGALALRPTRFAYPPLFSRARAAGLTDDELIGILEAESDRLAATDASGSGGADILLCRMTVAQILDSLYDPERQRTEKARVHALSAAADRQLQEIIRKYRFTTRIR